VRHLTEEYDVGSTTIYDLIKLKDRLLKLYSESEMCDGLIEGLEQREFITEQEIMSVYKIKETCYDKNHC
jgi:hypothetical protein